jgi:hypothetical protein
LTVVHRQVFEADEVRVVAATLTGRVQWWASDIDAASVWPLGCKDHRLDGNALDPSDRDGVGNAGRKEIVIRPVFGIYLPDGIASYTSHGDTYLVTAYEGDDADLERELRHARLLLEARPVSARVADLT